MPRTIKEILLKLDGKKEKYNILTFDTHERYQTQLCKTGHDFYSFRYSNCKKWEDKYAARPENYYILPENLIPNELTFDIILSQSKFGQFQMAQKINQKLNLPLISLEHTLPIKSWPDGQLEAFKTMKGDYNVFISEYSAKQWNVSDDYHVVHHSIDTDSFCPKEETEKEAVVLSVANDFINRDYCLNYQGWKRVTEDLPVKVVGDTPGLSEAAGSTDELIQIYQNSLIFFNSSTISPIPTSLLEAMSCGCAVVSTATCMIPEIIENGVNGFISNDESELRSFINNLLQDKEMAKEIGNNARSTILEKFSQDKFINKWNTMFDLAYGSCL